MQTVFGLSMRMKLFAGFAFIIFFLVMISTISYWGIHNMLMSQKSLYTQEFADILDIKAIRTQQNAVRDNLINILLLTDKDRHEQRPQNIFIQVSDNQSRMNRLIKRHLNHPQSLALLEQFNADQKEYNQIQLLQIVPLIDAGKTEEAKKIALGLQSSLDKKMQETADKLMNIAEQQAHNDLRKSERTANISIKLLGFGSVAAVLLSILMAIWVVTNLRQLSGKIIDGVNALASSTSEITAATTQVATGSAETATAVNQTTVTIEEIKQTSDISAQKARYVAEIAEKIVQISENGKKSMDDSVTAMERIQEQMRLIAQSIARLSEQNQDIGEIITTVNELAEQSNLLSVNASIEAAKAGEQGKGFSVVAHEVKSMATQSKQATAKIRTILGDIQKAMNSAILATEQGNKSVEKGVKLSADVNESIRLLASSIDESAQAARQIMASSQQQLIGMDQVALAMQSINQASEQNVASTRQVEKTAHDLNRLGQKLKLSTKQYAL